MMALLVQSALVLVVAFLTGLVIGEILGAALRPRPKVKPAPVELAAAEPEPEPEPALPVAVAAPPPPTPPTPVPAPPPPKPKWEERIFFPTATYGIAVRCCPPEINIVRRPGPSPLIGLSPAEQQDILARTQLSEEPEMLWKPQGAPDDLTRIGLDASEAKLMYRLGIFHAWQIAQWQPQHVLWIARRLKDPHHVVNGNWIGRAARMAG